MCAWIIVSHGLQIYNKIVEWRNNVRAELNRQSEYIFQDLTNPALDNEVYNSSDVNVDIYMRDNSFVRQRIDDIKSQYREYNKALAGAKKFEDVVDEKLLDAMYDNYSSKPKSTEAQL
jgi:hypothetical protein